jgi:hypothetical protein
MNITTKQDKKTMNALWGVIFLIPTASFDRPPPLNI